MRWTANAVAWRAGSVCCRELRRLQRRVPSNLGDPHRFLWVDESLPTSSAREAGHFLPIAHCTECGADGIAAAKREGDTQLQERQETIGQAWLDRSKTARFIGLGPCRDDEVPTQHLCPKCLRIGLEAGCVCQPAGEEPGRIEVHVGSDLSEQHPQQFLKRCPSCGAERALSILGSRAASLLSIGISHLFSSEYNLDKKLLAFTDSVQDASHRAGFFGARTYRFNLRTAIQAVVEAADDDVPFSEMPSRLLELWGERLDRPRLIATFLPPDLRDLPSYERFLERGGAGRHEDLEKELLLRLGWELSMEYGLSVRVGRTLERTLCSTVSVDREALERAVSVSTWSSRNERPSRRSFRSSDRR